MSRTADHSLELPPDVQALYAPVADALAEVEAVFRREMRSSDVLIDELARYGVLLGGKRLRPALVLLSGQAAGKLTDRHLVLGAVMEMIHTATLIHDDVLDEADVRRHLATINARWGEQASVLLGDLLFTRAFQLACTLDDMWVCRTVGQSTNLVCEGELRQVGNSGNLLLGESEYLRIIEAKTAELCACCCRVGARFAGADEQTEQQLEQYGRCLGIAFQIADDVLDLTGDEDIVGKTLGTDLQKRKLTLPLIHLIEQLDQQQRDELVTQLDEPPQRLRGLLDQWLGGCDAIGYARGKADAFARRAVEAIRPLPDNPAHRALVQLTRFVVTRSH